MGGKSAGYRMNKRNRVQLEELRERLSKCHRSDWRDAYCIFQRITELTNNNTRTLGQPAPRSCKYCGYFGHTQQHCAERKRKEAEQIEREIERDRQWRASYRPGDAVPENGYLSDS